MASINDIWWMTPLQTFASLGMAINFGGSVLQSPLIMPMLQLSSVPAYQSGKMNTYLLSNSEHFFPPLNAACTISNLVLAVTAYMNRHRFQACAEKVPLLVTATALGVATTIYALSVMVPINKRMASLADKLEMRNNDTKAETELRRLQRKWAKLNYGRAALMLTGAIVGINALLVDRGIPRQ